MKQDYSPSQLTAASLHYSTVLMVEPPDYEKIAKVYHTMGNSHKQGDKVQMAI